MDSIAHDEAVDTNDVDTCDSIVGAVVAIDTSDALREDSTVRVAIALTCKDTACNGYLDSMKRI